MVPVTGLSSATPARIAASGNPNAWTRASALPASWPHRTACRSRGQPTWAGDLQQGRIQAAIRILVPRPQAPRRVSVRAVGQPHFHLANRPLIHLRLAEHRKQQMSCGQHQAIRQQ
jgi:hypothetical protein